MKFTRIALATGLIFLTYNAGKLTGWIKGYSEAVNKYSEYIPDEKLTIKFGDGTGYIKFNNKG